MLKNKIEPLVSVVIPCYNHEDYIKASIQSVIDQDYKKIELIIIDDGSKDSSVSKITEMVNVCEKRFVRFEFRSRENRGISSTLNEAIDWCGGQYYSAIASDDIMVCEKTSIQVEYLNKHLSCVAVFGGVKELDKNGKILRRIYGKEKNYRFNDIFLHKHILPAPTQMIRLDSIKNVGGYPNGIIIEDWYMWLMLASSKGVLHRMNYILAGYRRHCGNVSSRLELMAQGRTQIINFFPNHILYKSAVDNANLQFANDLLKISRKGAIKVFINLLKNNKIRLLNFKYLKFFIKLVLPKKILGKKIY